MAAEALAIEMSPRYVRVLLYPHSASNFMFATPRGGFAELKDSSPSVVSKGISNTGTRLNTEHRYHSASTFGPAQLDC